MYIIPGNKQDPSQVTLQSDINGRSNVLAYIKEYFGDFCTNFARCHMSRRLVLTCSHTHI